MKNKMNVCFKLGFIFLMVCIGALAAAMIFGYVMTNKLLCTLCCMGGVVLAFAGIILVLCSKSKKPKPKKVKVPKEIDEDL